MRDELPDLLGRKQKAEAKLIKAVQEIKDKSNDNIFTHFMLGSELKHGSWSIDRCITINRIKIRYDGNLIALRDATNPIQPVFLLNQSVLTIGINKQKAEALMTFLKLYMKAYMPVFNNILQELAL